jgi:hypothetical protein
MRILDDDSGGRRAVVRLGGRDVSARSCKRGDTRNGSTNRPTTNPHVECPSPDLIIAIAACTHGLPLMPHHRNGRTGRDGVVRAEPGASSSAWFARRQADHGRHRSVIHTWERGEVASMIYCTEIGKACRCTCLCVYCSSSSFVLPVFVLTALHFSDADLFFPSFT